ncbi:hypothetical protein QTO34_001742 [Cnephaeus nilssonii]|uniref:Synaptonemal complex protein 2 n=1 Tax=Cnephaeus nilssonii TaxID=3371016 RepID=A0AA40HTL6_CNENI|nr:hypothetical protein QTO34_001742 [Eptesicus nilssonii]
MPIRPDLQQLEKCIDDALRKNDFKPLKTLLQIDVCEEVKIKCSKQFFHKLDDLICRELNKEDIRTVSIILISFGRCSRNISILGQAGLLTLIKQGLVQKIISEMYLKREIILSRGNSKDEAVINLIEDLFDLLMVVYGINDEGIINIFFFMEQIICRVLADEIVNICIQQETLKKMNAMLDKMPQDARKILYNQDVLILMNSMGERILDAGDYDLQVGIVEALCRMTTEKQRQKLARHWFSMDFIANAFKGIKDSEFETDCRIFLNLVNGMLGDKRRVFTYPCLSAFLDKYEDHQWEAVTVPEEEVQIYSIEEKESKKLLTIILKNILKISNTEGKELLLYFDASLEITIVTQKLFGANKHWVIYQKQGISIAETPVHILFDASGSQILVPESQISPIAEELISLKENPNSQKEFAKPPEYIKNSTQGDRKNSQSEIITPGKRKMSEASILVTGAEIYNKRSPLHLINTSAPRRGKIKPPLQVRSPAEKPGVSKTGVDNAVSRQSKSPAERSRENETHKHMKTADVTEKTETKDIEFLNQNFNDSQYSVLGSQAAGKIDKSVLPDVSYNIHGNKMPSKWACWTPVTNINLCDNQRASTSQGDTFIQDIAINKNKSSSSVSDDNSEETGKVEYKKEIMQHNKIDKGEVDVCRRTNQQLNQLSKQKNIENTKQSDWHIESETTFKSILLNKTVEESLVYRRKYILSKDVNTAICDKSPSHSKNTKSLRKSRKRLTSEFNSLDLKQNKMRENSKGKILADAAESLISQINKRYKPKDGIQSARKLKDLLKTVSFAFMSRTQGGKEKGQKKSYRQLKTTFVNVTSEHSLNDVYNFNLNGADEPIIKLGIQEFQATAREACMDNSIKLVGLRNHDEFEPSLKTKDKKVVRRHKNKNLFSDTDTEYSCDDGKTDISWLRESKSKPQLIGYSRNKSVKKKEKRGKSRPSLEREQPRSKMTPKKNITKKVDETIPDGRTRLPRRAANTRKNYKDLSNSESECEQEVSHSLKEKLLVKEENIHSRSKTMKLPKKQQNAFSAETHKDISKEWASSSLLKSTTIRDNSLDLSSVSLPGSPPSIEVMRCQCIKIIGRILLRIMICITKSISPNTKTSSPESFNSKYGVEGPVKSLKNNEKNLLCARESSPIPQSFSLESHSASLLSMSSEEGEKIRCDIPCDSAHVSGPTHHLNRKRMYIENINPDEVGLEEEEEGRANLLPQKLSKMENADHHSHKMSESTSSLSANDFSIPGKSWGTEISDVDMMCEQFNREFKKKYNSHHKLMDNFTMQSWKTAQQHLKIMNHHIQEYRIKKLDKFQFSIIKELENFEKDSQSLKDLEKEFAEFGEKMVQKFSVYQKSEQERLHLLKASLDKNVFYGTDREETICTSEMCFMKENMKILQDKLLKKMQEEELLNVRKGLLSLFMACETNANVEI